MMSNIVFERLEVLPKIVDEVDQQLYQDVSGFESLRKIFIIPLNRNGIGRVFRWSGPKVLDSSLLILNKFWDTD